MNDVNTEKKTKKPSKKTLTILAIAAAAFLILGIIIYCLTYNLTLAAIIALVVTVISAFGIRVICTSIANFKIAREKGIDNMRVGSLKDMMMGLLAIVACLFICYVIVNVNIPKP